MTNQIVGTLILLSELGLFAWYLWDVPRRKPFAAHPIYGMLLLLLFGCLFVLRNLLLDNSFISAFVLFLAGILILHAVSLSHAIFLASMFTAFLYASGMVLLYPVMLLRGIAPPRAMEYGQPLLLLVELVSLLLKCVSVGLFRRLIPSLLQVQLNRIQLMNAFLPVVFAMVVNTASTRIGAGEDQDVQRVIDSLTFMLGIYIYLSSAGTALAVWYQYRDGENQRIRQSLQRQYAGYERSREQEEMIREMNHDLKNHLLVIDRMEQPEQIHAYVSSILGKLSAVEQIHYTNNLIVDSLINTKMDLMRSRGITLKVVADFSTLRGIEDPDLCAIVGNALDNAVEAVTQVEEAEKRMITMKGYTQSGMWVLLLSNYFSGSLRRENGGLQSTHGSGRGLGMKSIRYAVQKYGGSLSYEVRDDYFTLKVIWPEQTEE